MSGKSAGRQRAFAWFAALVLAYNLPVILWGAYVRASFSGDGCGANWPTCNGSFVPQRMAVPMMIEYTHRLMTSVDTVSIAVLVAWAFWAFPKRHAARRYSLFSLLFLLVEALLGAGLVLFRYVAQDHSAGRVWYLSAHLTNTMLLLAALTITAWLAFRGVERFRLAELSRNAWAALAFTVLVSVTGTVAALGDMLFPAASLSAGIERDFARGSDALLRLRMIHPAIAIAGAVYLMWFAWRVLRGQAEEGSGERRAAIRVLMLTFLQLAMGAVNLSLLAPIWTQLTHLLLADLVWISVVLLAVETAAMAQRELVTSYPAALAAG